MTTAPPPPPQPHATAKTPFYKRRLVHFLAVGVVALGGGIALGNAVADPTSTTQYRSLSDKNESLSDDLAEAEKKAALVDEVDQRSADLDEREQELEAQATQQEETDDSLTEREKAVGIKEKEVVDNTISGDGTYEVGVDMKPGKYKSKNASTCYWSINADANGSNIIQNGLSSGPQTVTVSKGQYLETSTCGDWVRQ